MTNLHPAIGPNRFCGPSAIAIVTGKSTKETSRVIREVTGKRAVYGVRYHDLTRAFTRAGVKTKDIPCALMNISQFVRDRVQFGFSGVYILYVTKHYCVVEIQGDQAWVCDNNTVYPIELARYLGRRKRIKSVLKVC